MQNLKLKILVIGSVWPEPESSAAGTRMMQLLSFFTRANFEITFASTALRGEFSAKMQGIASEQIEMNSDSFDLFIKDLNPTYVLFDRFMVEEQFGWRVSNICPDAIKILDTEDLHCLRKSREVALKNNVIHNFDQIVQQDIALREIASILRCDLSLIISEVEIDILTRIFIIDSSLLYYLPLFTSRKELITDYEQRDGFVFIGNFLHKPNEDAVRFLKETLWPLIRKQLKVTLHIYGAYVPERVQQWHNPEQGFLIHGRAKNSQEVISKARVMLAPLRFGAGLKGKLLEAMAVGTPSVTSLIGAEGISLDLWNGFVEDDHQRFADASVKLYSDPDLWTESQEIGFEIIDERFSADDFYSDFVDMLQLLASELQSRRQANFIGRLLQHHSMRSTEYMSRWIQAKNQK